LFLTPLPKKNTITIEKISVMVGGGGVGWGWGGGGGGGGLTRTSRRGFLRLEGPLQNYDPCKGAENIAEERWLVSTKLV